MATIELASGGKLTISAEVDLFELSDEDRRFLLDLVDRVKGYGKEPAPLFPRRWMSIGPIPPAGTETGTLSFSLPEPEIGSPLKALLDDIEATKQRAEDEAPSEPLQPADPEPVPELPETSTAPRRLGDGDKRRQLILAALREAGGTAHTSHLRDTTGIGAAILNSDLYHLKSKGLATSDGKGTWSVVEDSDKPANNIPADVTPQDVQGSPVTAGQTETSPPAPAPEPVESPATPEPVGSALTPVLPEPEPQPAPSPWRDELVVKAEEARRNLLNERYGPVVAELPPPDLDVTCERCKEPAELACPDFWGGRLRSVYHLCRTDALKFAEANHLTITKAREFAESRKAASA